MESWERGRAEELFRQQQEKQRTKVREQIARILKKKEIPDDIKKLVGTGDEALEPLRERLQEMQKNPETIPDALYTELLTLGDVEDILKKAAPVEQELEAILLDGGERAGK